MMGCAPVKPPWVFTIALPGGVALVALVAVMGVEPAVAGGAKRPQPEPAKTMRRVIAIDPIPDRYIELPDPAEPVVWYGRNIHERLLGDLYRAGDTVVLVPGKESAAALELQATMEDAAARGVETDPCLISTAPIASSRVAIHIDELSFATGSRGGRMLYGFTRGHENAYNSGTDMNRRNEFPPQSAAEPSWFESAFHDSGGLRTGLELGHEINFDVLLLGAKLKHHEYHAALGLDVQFQNHVGEPVRHHISANGHGFYFDLSAHLLSHGSDYLAGVTIARKTALLDAFHRAVGAAVATIGAELSKLPLIAKVAVKCEDAFHVSAGANHRVAVGQRFYDASQLKTGRKPAVLTVERVFLRSSSVRVDAGAVEVGDELVSLATGERPPEPESGVAVAAVRGLASDLLPLERGAGIPNVDIDVPAMLSKFIEGFFTRLWAGLKDLVTLPYRIYRYFNYDQEYKGGELWQVDAARAAALSADSWAMRAIGAPKVFSDCIGRDATCLGRRNIIVAVIDTGIDYNHVELRRNIFWDGVGNTPGFDFISGDPRPYDDHAHGTGIASIIAGGGAEIVGVAPNVTLLPAKVFDPYGVTSSAALYAAFEYAIAEGAKIIVTGWATQRSSKALEDGVRLAAANGALVIAAAGDGAVDISRWPYYPAALNSAVSNMIVVAAQSEDGGLSREQGRASNYGKIVDLAAPGAGVRMAMPRNRYQTLSGTGIAAGFVAGAAALVWSRCHNKPVDAAQVKTIVLSGAQVTDALRGEVIDNKSLFVAGAIDKADQVCK